MAMYMDIYDNIYIYIYMAIHTVPSEKNTPFQKTMRND